MGTETLKVLGQSAPAATTATTLYTVPASTTTVVSKLLICNQNAYSAAKVRIWVAVAGAADTAKQYVYYDVTLNVFTTLDIACGLSLGAGDLLRIQTDTANVSFSAFGAETTVATSTVKTLGQSAPAATTPTTLYTVPAGKTAVLSSLFACNQSTTVNTVRIWIAVAGAADTAKQYLFYDFVVGAGESLVLRSGIALGAGDLVRVQSSAGSMSFNAFGIEV